MPFTACHPAAILPFITGNKKRFSTTGLVIGSMVPDFEYFLRFKVISDYSHTILGIFWFDLPLAIVIAFTFHCLIRNSFINNLPSFVKRKLITSLDFNWSKCFISHWLIVLYSIVIGTATHLIWDSFTHHNGFFIHLWSLEEFSIDLFNISFPLYKLAQHASSLIGGLVIFASFLQLPEQPTEHVPNAQYWLITCTIACTFTIIYLLFNFKSFIIGNLIASMISITFTSILLTSAVYQIKAKPV
ncbi:DUF4184 family protein [Fulvivirga ligni]|uniref:DUF4184 family protein n=1 Tax=Fulvivirga ligni TaxID=2904246 RepID=UPI001F2E202C|nr:DUF4184 family protein [Fulvivirga ligni]UII19843.1 DUF4184 family protein [Fulvivirga ligni]